MKKGLAIILLLLAMVGPCFETLPLNATTQLTDKTLEEKSSQFEKFRLLVIDVIESGGGRLQSGQYFIRKLIQYPNWNNITGEAYIHLLSRYTSEEIITECKTCFVGNSTKANMRNEILGFLANASSNEFAVLYYNGFGLPLELHLDEVITASELLNWLGAVKCTLCVILDACHSGSWIDDGQGGVLGPNKVVLCSSKSNQLSWGSLYPYDGGFFTGFESQNYPNGTSRPVGLIGSTIAGIDTNADGWLSVMECFAYAQPSVQQLYPVDLKYHQDPVSYNGLTFDPQFVQLPLKPPVANFTHSPSMPWVNESVLFNASTSNGTIVKYAWNFGDNTTEAVTEPTINHTHVKEGSYTVTLNVTDIYGQWNTTSTQIIITYSTDINKDRTVNILDIFVVAMAFGSKPGDPNWNATADLNKDATVNILDIFAVAWDFGKQV
jgi:hypothetical protein